MSQSLVTRAKKLELLKLERIHSPHIATAQLKRRRLTMQPKLFYKTAFLTLSWSL